MLGSLLSTVLAAAIALGAARPAAAGIADSPLPAILPGATTLHLYSVPGIVRSNGILEAYFSCTSMEATATAQVGVELFSSLGGVANDAVATSLSVAPGATVLFATGAFPVWTSIDSSLGGGFSRASARILATSKKIACSAFLADPGNAPPTSMTYLTIISKLKQKACN